MSVLPLSMKVWLADVRSYIALHAADLLPLYEIYAGEACFGRCYINADLLKLPAGAAILEVGAGGMLLSCQLAQEGFNVSSLDPVGGGFSHFERMRALVMQCAVTYNCLPKLLNFSAEELSAHAQFDYAFSINVMEHVGDVRLSILNVAESLRPNCKYKFTCANYWFPYEPHFNIPTFFSKSLTERLMRRKIFGHKVISDPEGTWRSLNWISIREIRQSIKFTPELTASFNRHMLVSTLERVVNDQEFAMRRSQWMRTLITICVQLRMHHLLAMVPAIFQPVIDCEVIRSGKIMTNKNYINFC